MKLFLQVVHSEVAAEVMQGGGMEKHEALMYATTVENMDIRHDHANNAPDSVTASRMVMSNQPPPPPGGYGMYPT